MGLALHTLHDQHQSTHHILHDSRQRTRPSRTSPTLLSPVTLKALRVQFGVKTVEQAWPATMRMIRQRLHFRVELDRSVWLAMRRQVHQQTWFGVGLARVTMPPRPSEVTRTHPQTVLDFDMQASQVVHVKLASHQQVQLLSDPSPAVLSTMISDGSGRSSIDWHLGAFGVTDGEWI